MVTTLAVQTCCFISDDDTDPFFYMLTGSLMIKMPSRQREDRNDFIQHNGRAPGQQENEAISGMENFNSDLFHHLDLLGTKTSQ